MIELLAVYHHPHLNHLVQVTGQQGNWVEFVEINTGNLRWLERQVFEFAYRYRDPGQELVWDLVRLRAQAREQGILVPEEFA